MPGDSAFLFVGSRTSSALEEDVVKALHQSTICLIYVVSNLPSAIGTSFSWKQTHAWTLIQRGNTFQPEVSWCCQFTFPILAVAIFSYVWVWGGPGHRLWSLLRFFHFVFSLRTWGPFAVSLLGRTPFCSFLTSACAAVAVHNPVEYLSGSYMYVNVALPSIFFFSV